jgi:alpha-glucosidase (family GH31 glycosyl hydrolase)
MDVDHVGEAFALWVSEPGIGKVDSDDEPDDWFLTGTRHATSYPDPFLLRPEPMGLMVDTAARIDVDLCTGDGWTVAAWDGASSFILVDGASPLEVVRNHTRLVGLPPQPPSWALAPWNDAVMGADRVRAVAAALRAADAPSSVIWTEDWKGGEDSAWGYHISAEWDLDRALYPEAEALDAELEAQGFKWLAYFSPFLETGSRAWDEAIDLAIRDPQGEPYVFTGAGLQDTTVLDLTRDEARTWAQEKMEAAVAAGFDGWMADFAEWLPVDAELDQADALDAHNAYPLWWQDTNRVLNDAHPDLVWFTRSGWSGTSARAPTQWGGDQRTSFDADDGFPTVIPMGIGAGLTGAAWWGSDIGGYQSIGNPPSTKELWFRWCTLGALSPVMRTHHGAFAADNWQFDTDAETLAHFAAWGRFHTRLYPYLRALGRDASRDGTPLLLAPFLVFPEEPWDRVDAWLLGPSLLVAPVMAEGATARDVQLPAGVAWYDLWTGAPASSGSVDAAVDTIPVFAPAGAVLPMFVDAPDTLVGGPLDGVTTLADVDGRRVVNVYAGAPGSFAEADGTRYSHSGDATSSGTATATFASGTLSAGGLSLEVSGSTEREYTLVVAAP